MTTTAHEDQFTPAPVEVTQEDREAAAEYVAENFSDQQAEQTRLGTAFVHLVQAFARHRTASAPAGEAEVETMRQMREIAREMGYRDVLDALEALDDLRAPAGEVEPVAWMYDCIKPVGDRKHLDPPFMLRHRAHMDLHYWTETPLYTHPPAPADLVELVEAARAVIDNTHVGKHGQTVSERSKYGNYEARYYHRLRAALAKHMKEPHP